MPSFDHLVTTHPDIPPFPSPQTFDILPELYAVVSRFQLTSTITNGASPTPILTATSTSPLKPKDFPAAAVPIKQKIQKARAAVISLPDVERDIEAQEQEIRVLETRCKMLRDRIGELAGLAQRKEVKEAGEAVVAMEGIEGSSALNAEE